MDYNEEKVKDAIHRRTLKYWAAHPGASFEDSLNYVVGQLDRAVGKVVEHYDADSGVCDLYDPKTGRRSTSPCEPTGRTRKKEDQKTTGGYMNADKILSAESVVDVRAQERMAKGKATDYGEATRSVLADDPHLAHCYNHNLPYLESSGARIYQDEMPNVSAKGQLGVLINGARLASNAPDVPLMLQIANLTPDLVRAAAGERLDEIANAFIDKMGMSGQKADRYPEALSQVRRDNPALVAAAESGQMNEEALREIFYPWFSAKD